MTKGSELTTFITGLNGGASVDATLLDVLVSTAKAIIEEERPWMVLRKVDTSKSVTTAGTWQTAIDLTTITDFSRFYSDLPFKLFDSATNRLECYRIKPFDRRLMFKDVSNTAVFDHNAKQLYLNGVPPFAGTLYISYVSTSTEIDLTITSAVWSLFPSRFLPILGFYAMGIHKGAVDYDDVVAHMLPENKATLLALKNAMEKWDDDLQQTDLVTNDPEDFYDYPRAGAVNIHDI